MATTIIPKPKQLRLVRKGRIEAEALLAIMVRHLARREIKAEWASLGRRITAVDAVALATEVHSWTAAENVVGIVSGELNRTQVAETTIETTENDCKHVAAFRIDQMDPLIRSVFCSVMASNAAAAPNPEILPLESLLGDGPLHESLSGRGPLSGKGTIPVTRNAKITQG
jgi:hypothetical protein